MTRHLDMNIGPGATISIDPGPDGVLTMRMRGRRWEVTVGSQVAAAEPVDGSVKAFAGQHIHPSPGSAVGAREVYLAYEKFSYAENAKPVAERTFARSMVAMGFKKKHSRVRKYLDVEIK